MMEWGASPSGSRRGRGQGDQIIYYRRPRTTRDGQPAENAGWITWGDSLSGTKLRDYLARGFEPLMKYGTINRQEMEDRREKEGLSNGEYIWQSILEHPDGPGEFPLEQIMAFHWYRPELCPVQDAIFPALVGKKVREFRCPERCGRAPFVEVDGRGAIGPLATHLRVMHEWDRTALIAWGQTVGIDFNQPDVGGELIEEVDTSARERAPRRQRPQPQVPVEVV